MPFSQFIAEKMLAAAPTPKTDMVKHDEHQFEKHKTIGWWDDDSTTHLDVYHGTHKRNLDSIRKNGLNRSDQKTGMVSVTPDPNTAHAYASMSGAGGEAEFRGVSHRPATTPHEDRVTTRFSVPKTWLRQHADPHLRGNVGVAQDKMSNRAHYDSWKASNPTKPDTEYYMGTEIRLNKPIPPEFYSGHSYKVKKT